MMRPGEIIVDSFAGGGGASLGISWALGRGPDIAINHDKEAIALHAANHPDSRHYAEDVWKVDPVEACAGRPVGLMWLSPDCKHFSKAKGGKPVSKRVRGLAWVGVRWAAAVRPRVIVLENVEEFQGWGPVLVTTGRPCPARKGKTFRAFKRKFERLGYEVDHRELVAADFGAATSRRRFFMVARCDGEPIVWPTPTHGPGRAKPWRSAGECMDFTDLGRSIFGRKKPLAENTLRRIARGVQRFVVEAADPFIVNMAHGGKVESLDDPLSTIATERGGCRGLVVPVISKAHSHGWDKDGGPSRSARDPLWTVVAKDGTALVAAFLAKHYGGHETPGASLFDPLSTITTMDHHALVHAFLVAYYGNEKDGASLREPARTITARDRFALVTVHGQAYHIADIRMRMLKMRELYRCQGFPDTYQINVAFDGKPLTQEAQGRMVGNSVVPHLAEAIVRANVVGGVDIERDLFSQAVA